MITPTLQQKTKGFVILFAMLIASIVLLVSAGIFNVVQKEIVLSSAARESQRAFYAADAALECALYADIVGIGDVNPSTPFSIYPTGEEQYFDCSGDTVTSYYLPADGTLDYEIIYAFRHYNANDISGGCAFVLVEKSHREEIPTPNGYTRITAVGFNACVSANMEGRNTPDFNDPTLLERRLSITYSQ